MLSRFRKLTLATVLAVAVLATPASAAPLFKTSEYPATLTGISTGLHPFASHAGAIWKCGFKSSMTGFLNENSSTITLAPTYTECTILETSMTVQVNGCSYLLHAQEAVKELADTFRGTFDIVCPAGKAIEFLWGGGCTWRFPAQTAVQGFTATVKTAAEPKDVLLKLESKQLTHSEEGFSFACPNKGTFTDGSLLAEVTLRADGAGGKLLPFWLE